MQKAPTLEYQWSVYGSTRKVFHQRHYLTDRERREFMARYNATTLVVFEYLLRQTSTPESQRQPLNDQTLATELGLSLRNAKKIRLQLEKDGWLQRDKFRNKQGHAFERYQLWLQPGSTAALPY